LIPTQEDLDLDIWRFERMPRFEGLARTIARYPGGVTLMFAEQEDGSYAVTKMQGGRILKFAVFPNLPPHILTKIDRRRPRGR
jgi:hypothetical protein